MEKHKFCLCLLLITTALNLSAQDFNLSAVGGYLNLDINFKVNGEEFDLGNKSSGFYIGALTNITLTEKIDLQPELLFGAIEDNNSLYLGALGKYNVSDEFSLLLGPAFNYLLEDIVDDYSKLGIFAVIGPSYDITDKFFAQAKYSFQLNNFYTGDSDITSRANFLLVGVGYKIL